jgi:hypothetical protein
MIFIFYFYKILKKTIKITKMKKKRSGRSRQNKKKIDGRRQQQKKSLKKKSRCWVGYEPTPGKIPYSKGSCRKIQ